MGLFDFLQTKKKAKVISIADFRPQQEFKETEAHSGYYANRRHWQPIITEHFDGEKTPGEMGAPRNLIPLHNNLSARVYEANLKSDVVKIITGKFFKWVIGSGLKLQTEPKELVLETEKIKIKDAAGLRKVIEARFHIYSSSKQSDYKGISNLHTLSNEAYQASFLGGDCLHVLRVSKKGVLSSQVIEGRSIQTPFLDRKLMQEVKQRGNTVRHGVELSDAGEHISFFVLVNDNKNILGKFIRIEAKGKKTGRQMARMIYGSKHRLDDVRGIPRITQILEKVEKFDRYTEATVGTAEERAKIAYSIEHDRDSDGSNPLVDKARVAAGMGQNAACETTGYALGEKTAAIVAATTGKQTFNMPIGAKMTALDTKAEVQYGPFSKSIFSYMCASVDIPPEVAMQLYEQNYSSSRAAINSWDYVVKVDRKAFSDAFYKPFYALWFELEVINNKIKAPGFLAALRKDNFMVTEAYLNCRFIGANMPHIDPLKEVKAVREMLGDKAPLISHEQAAEILGLGDWGQNVEQYKTEEEMLPEISETEKVALDTQKATLENVKKGEPEKEEKEPLKKVN